MTKFAFIKSTRFWALILIAITGILESEQIIGSDICQAIITILGGFTIIRSVDRFGDKLAE